MYTVAGDGLAEYLILASTLTGSVISSNAIRLTSFAMTTLLNKSSLSPNTTVFFLAFISITNIGFPKAMPNPFL